MTAASSSPLFSSHLSPVDPVAPLTRQWQALLSVSMQKTRGWGPLQHAKSDLGMSTPPGPWPSLTQCPRARLFALQSGHWSTVVYRSPNLVQGQPSLWAEDTCLQLDLRVGEWMTKCRRCTSQHLSCEGKGQQATSAHPYVQTSCLAPNWKG